MGTIEFDTGFANVVVVYRAICFRPFVNEVLDAAVSHVTELGFFAEVGPLEVFVSRLVSPATPKNGERPWRRCSRHAYARRAWREAGAARGVLCQRLAIVFSVSALVFCEFF